MTEAPRRAGATAIILNEGAGSARTPHVRRAVEATRRLLDADLHVTSTRDPKTLMAWLHDTLPTGTPYATVVVAGGDGTLSVAYNALAGRDVTIGYLPAGFGNATRHLLRLPKDPDAQAAVIATGAVREVDMLSVNGHLALFAGAGWDARVADRYTRAGARRLPGWAAAVARSVPDLWRRPSVRVGVDGATIHDGPMELLVVGTTPYFGRGLQVNPGARVDAGELMVRVYPGPAPALALEALRWATRRTPRAIGHPAQVVELRVANGEEVPVQADGDVIGSA
ncbi:MAG: diacylglycerol kinase family protein, partial [Chloroflexota bacterium]